MDRKKPCLETSIQSTVQMTHREAAKNRNIPITNEKHSSQHNQSLPSLQGLCRNQKCS